METEESDPYKHGSWGFLIVSNRYQSCKNVHQSEAMCSKFSVDDERGRRDAVHGS